MYTNIDTKWSPLNMFAKTDFVEHIYKYIMYMYMHVSLCMHWYERITTCRNSWKQLVLQCMLYIAESTGMCRVSLTLVRLWQQ